MSRRYHLNPPVLVFFGLAVVIGLVAMNNQNNLLFWVFGVMVAALFVSGVVSGIMLTGIVVRRLDPRHGSVGEPLVVRYAVRNRNHFVAAFNIHIEDLAAPPRPWWRKVRGFLAALPGCRFDLVAAVREERDQAARGGSATFWKLMRPARALVMHVGPREQVHGEAVFWPSRRGKADFEHVRISTTFPFGLLKKSITFHQPTHTLIHPRLYELRRGVLGAVAPMGPLGGRTTHRAGVGDEYYGLREYRPGDMLHHIAWKRSATRDEIICVEHTQSGPPRLRVAIDLTSDRVADDPQWRQREEEAISLAASIVHAADAAGYEVGMSILGLPVPSLPIRRSRWHLGRMMVALASIDPDEARSPAARSSLPEAERAVLVVVHPDRVDPTVGRADAWHLTARQLDQLAVRPIGWDPHNNETLLIPAPAPAESAA